MSQPYVGEIRMMANNYAPAGWELCNGQELPISENDVLFMLIGTQYGGDGESTFALPNLQARIPVGTDGGQGSWGTQWMYGQMAGTDDVTLTTQQIPVHTHPMVASTDPGNAITPDGNVIGALASMQVFRPTDANQPFNASSIQPAGGSQPHDNMHPFLAINFIISLFGIFPSQT